MNSIMVSSRAFSPLAITLSRGVPVYAFSSDPFIFFQNLAETSLGFLRLSMASMPDFREFSGWEIVMALYGLRVVGAFSCRAYRCLYRASTASTNLGLSAWWKWRPANVSHAANAPGVPSSCPTVDPSAAFPRRPTCMAISSRSMSKFVIRSSMPRTLRAQETRSRAFLGGAGMRGAPSAGLSSLSMLTFISACEASGLGFSRASRASLYFFRRAAIRSSNCPRGTEGG